MAKIKFNKLENFGFWLGLIPFAGALVACSPVSSGSAEACAALNSTIDRNIVEIAVSDTEGEGKDTSAMQQGARFAQNNNRLSTIILNLQLQAQNKCPPRQVPIDASIYSKQASDCYLARMEQSIENYGSDEGKKKTIKTKATLACDFKIWNTQVAK
ncbi:hypothetical protein [Actimicrobium sp. CCI2.3]|uniref:hypothetical protein n=1 Tax=Actimicrobium sp. CCI2.3 TaxID=3048616 RepID=UPI002AB572DA|nr:hypothetical protein [Actimicrobium sp. CCI2.3]MDY7573037.1 hypothetical protein [Actimicrobium sp. CCI2.3]MEB0020835.1 hypothetical protein [Actimicrobium sp. CCI2.3]